MATRNLGNVRALIASASAPTNTNLIWRDTSTVPFTTRIYNTQTSTWEAITMGGGGSGETNTASNIGTGSQIFESKVGVDLRFRTLTAGSNITLTQGAQTVMIDAAASGEANTASNLGSGEGLAGTKSGVNLPFKSLVGGTNVNLTSDANTVTINSTDTGEANTASNQGAGEGLVLTKSGVNLPFKTLTAGSNITLTPSTNELQINANTSMAMAMRSISSSAISASGTTHTVNFMSSAVRILNVANAVTTLTLAVSNLSNTIERNNKLVIDNSANTMGLTVTFNDQSSAISYRRALNEFPGTYPNMNVAAGTRWELEMENLSTSIVYVDFVQVEQ